MIIMWGFKDCAKSIHKGMFDCPTCGLETNYALKENRKYFTLYTYPVIPLKRYDRFIECQKCKQIFEPTLVYEPDIDHSSGWDTAAFWVNRVAAVGVVVTILFVGSGIYMYNTYDIHTQPMSGISEQNPVHVVVCNASGRYQKVHIAHGEKFTVFQVPDEEHCVFNVHDEGAVTLAVGSHAKTVLVNDPDLVYIAHIDNQGKMTLCTESKYQCPPLV